MLVENEIIDLPGVGRVMFMGFDNYYGQVTAKVKKLDEGGIVDYRHISELEEAKEQQKNGETVSANCDLLQEILKYLERTEWRRANKTCPVCHNEQRMGHEPYCDLRIALDLIRYKGLQREEVIDG